MKPRYLEWCSRGLALRNLKFLLLAVGIQFLALSGCGGGGGSTTGGQPTTAIVKLATSGSLPTGTLISGITTTLNYPTTKGLSIGPSNVVASGVGFNSAIQPNTTIAGQAGIGLVSAGIQTGEFATLTFSIAPGFPLVTATDFTIAPGATIIDINTSPIPGISVVIQSVSIQ
jgi:hypothetical protein